MDSPSNPSISAPVAAETAKTVTMVAAHTQLDHESVLFYYPEHFPRASDPHYHLFDRASKRILSNPDFSGCWICGTKEHIEFHHAECEYAAAGGVDVTKFEELFPEYDIKSEDDFLAWVESEGNLLALCAFHHRSPYAGIHHCPYPNWKLQRIWRKDIPAVVQAAPGSSSDLSPAAE